MQEEVTQKTIALAIKTSKLTAGALKEAMRLYLQRRQKRQENTHGKMSVRELVGKGDGAKSIEISDKNIKSFERVARKYNVDFAVKKDKSKSPPQYVVFFRGRDADVIANAFKEFVHGNEQKIDRPSVRQKLEHLKEVVTQAKNRERTREKHKDRGNSL